MSNQARKHTAGPWFGKEGISGPDGKLICQLSGDGLNAPEGTDRPYAEWSANSLLIQAAPDMLRDLRFLAENLDHDGERYCATKTCLRCTADAVIAKAEGRDK